MTAILRRITHELKHHVPFTLLGTAVGVGVLAAIVYGGVARQTSERLFAVSHPAHVLLSALATAGVYRLYGRAKWWATVLVGCAGAIAVATLSDSLIPFLGEWLLAAGDEHVTAHAHVGFIELWWLVVPAGLLGAGAACVWPRTRLPHAGHVMLSTAASLFHMTMAMSPGASVWSIVAAGVFLFLAVWVPCCTSDVVLPLLLVPKADWPVCEHCKDTSDDNV